MVVDVLCSEPCMWGVLCSGLINSLRVLGLEDRECRWGKKRLKEGVQGHGSVRSELGMGRLGHGVMIHR